ncbi:MAG: hypothetical protein WCP85_09780 [Mariniphaga sp.]
MEIADVRIGQIVTVSRDLESIFRVKKIMGGKAQVFNKKKKLQLIANIVDLKLVIS